MAKRGVTLITLGVVQAVYLIVSALYIHHNGFPVLGEGRTNPYLAYLAINTITIPLATLLLPILFTLAVSRRPITARTRRMLREVWLNSLVFVPAAALIFKGFIEGRVGQLVLHSDRPLWLLLIEGLVVLLLADLWFYATHRALHSRLLYRFHKAHHAHLVPTEAAAFMALSPVEAYLSGLFMISFPMVVLPVDARVMIGCAGIILFFGFYIHEGALLGAPALPLVNGPAEHQLHHGRGRKNANYALIFPFIDRIFGTYAAPSPVVPAVLDKAPRPPVIRS